jgi:hypothetical protein
MTDQFHKKEDEYLRIIKGDYSNMIYCMRVGLPNLLGSTHFLYGPLIQFGSQLFLDLAPMINTGSYVQIRQKTDMDDTIAVEVVVNTEVGNKHIKNPDWHYQRKNKENLYYSEFKIDSIPIQLAIGSRVSEKDLLEYFEEKTSN